MISYVAFLRQSLQSYQVISRVTEEYKRDYQRDYQRRIIVDARYTGLVGFA
jgi:hypothetical protein